MEKCQACQQLDFGCIVDKDKATDGCCSPCVEAGLECSFGTLSPRSRKRRLLLLSDDGCSTSDNVVKSGRIQNKDSPHTAATLTQDFASSPASLTSTLPLGLQSHRHSRYLGHTADFEPLFLNFSNYDPQNENTSSHGALRKVKNSVSFLIIPDNKTQGYENQDRDIKAVEALVAPHGRKLIDLFFRIIHPSFPICQKDVFIETYQRDYRQILPALLATIYVLAIHWWAHCPELADLPPPSNTVELEKLIYSSLTDSMSRPKLSTVEAALLLSQRPGNSQWAAPTAQLVAIGHELGLHLDCSNWDIPSWEKGFRKRLSWSLYMQDKWGALIHGRPSHISPSNWAVRKLTLQDFAHVEWHQDDDDDDDDDAAQDKEDCKTGQLIFIQFVELTEILDEILETLYTVAALQKVENAGARGAQIVLAQAKPIQLKLKAWYAALPFCLCLEPLSSGGRRPARMSSVGYLHLAYFATEVTLHRRIIGSLSAATVDPFMEHICRSAARARLISSMDFVNRLSPEYLRSFWYFASKTNFALIGTFGLLLWASSPCREEADWYRRRLSEYRWTLSASAKPGQGEYLTAFAVDMLDVSTDLLLRQLPEKPAMSSGGTISLDFAGSSFSGFGQGGVGGGGGGFYGQTGPGNGLGGSRSSRSSLESEDDMSDVEDSEDDGSI